MAKEIRLAQLGQTMEEGTIVEFLVGVGDAVKKGDCIFEVETDKTTLEVESPQDGFVKQFLVEKGDTLLVGDPVLVLGGKDEEIPAGFIESLKAGGAQSGQAKSDIQAEPAEVGEVVQGPSKAQEQKETKRIKASPRAKRKARQAGVDLTSVKGSGPAGKITEQDVEKAAAAKQSPQRGTSNVRLGESIEISRLQKLTAERMVQSKRDIPCFYLAIRADVTELVKLRTTLKEQKQQVSYNDFIIKAVADSLSRFPIMTGQFQKDTIRLAEQINIGLAVAVPEGLIVPVVKEADKKSVFDIAADTKMLIEKAQNNQLALSDLEGACTTVSNLGGFGVESFIPIVIPGQCFILGVGKISDTCVPANDGVQTRKLLSLVISVDHKVANGAYAAKFLENLKNLLEDTASFV